MKLHKVQIANINNNAKTQATPFKGGADALISFWDTIGRGGFAAQFILQDVTGANIPRTIIALNRNKGEDGKLNYVAGGEVAIREFTTSPSMFIVPAAMMAVMTAVTGKANRVSLKNLEDLSSIMKESCKQGAVPTREAFYKSVINAATKNTYEKEAALGDDFIKMIFDMEGAKKRNIFQKMFNKDIKDLKGQSKDQIMTKLEKLFIRSKQENVDDYAQDLTAAVLTKNGKETNLETLLKEMKNYYDDFSEHFKGSATDEMVDKFKNIRIGSRVVSGIVLAASTAVAMIFIPKLYTLSKNNPENSKSAQQEVSK